jgi:uncharacterized 2Fe-2S/4Fe-4S cluster protein (DUF4445 family)
MPNTDKIEIFVDGVTHLADKGTKLSEILEIDMPCAGKGRCGKCKIIATGELSEICENERKALSEQEISDNIRLACQTFALGKCEVFTDLQKIDSHQIVTHSAITDFDIAPSFEKFGVAIDVGTTTIAANLFDQKGNLLACASDLNPQGRFGADVISRIETSLGGRSKELADAICQGIDKLILSLCADAKIDSLDVESIVITGNTAMLYLLTNSSPITLSKAPFIADKYFGESFLAKEFPFTTLDENTNIYLPPCIAAFVGADTVCAILATDMLNKNEHSLLVDIGTNGEMALFDGQKISVCSTAAGPAFEGVGISMGMRGAPGAIDKVSIANGKMFCHVIDNRVPIGICGSGLIDAAACLLDLELLDETGYLEDEEVVLDAKVTLTQQDIRMLQLAKSAIYSGICTLMRSCAVEFKSIDTMYIAGGFGNYLNMQNAARVGLIPKELLDRIKVIGNAALAGASMILLNDDIKVAAQNIAQMASTVELSSNPVFSELYMDNMMF